MSFCRNNKIVSIKGKRLLIGNFINKLSSIKQLFQIFQYKWFLIRWGLSIFSLIQESSVNLECILWYNNLKNELWEIYNGFYFPKIVKKKMFMWKRHSVLSQPYRKCLNFSGSVIMVFVTIIFWCKFITFIRIMKLFI